MSNDSTTSKHPSYASTSCVEHDVEQAILASKREDRVVELEDGDGLREQLLAECEGSDDDGLYWGEDCEGAQWSVRVV